MKPEHKHLLLDTLAKHGSCDVLVHGRSMWPFIRPGDTVTVDSGFTRPAKGMVVAVFGEDQLIVHRVLGYRRSEQGRWAIRIQGDSSPFSAGLIDSGQVVGVVHGLKRNGRLSRAWFRPPLSHVCILAGFAIQRAVLLKGKLSGHR